MGICRSAKQFPISLIMKAFIIFSLIPTLMAGLTLINFGAAYPKVQEVKQLIEPLAYLTTSTEYDAVEKCHQPKSWQWIISGLKEREILKSQGTHPGLL